MNIVFDSSALAETRTETDAYLISDRVYQMNRILKPMTQWFILIFFPWLAFFFETQHLNYLSYFKKIPQRKR